MTAPADIIEKVKYLREKITDADYRYYVLADPDIDDYSYDMMLKELDDIEKLGFTSPLAREEIKDPDFNKRRRKINEDLRQNEVIIKEYQDQINFLSAFLIKLHSFKGTATVVSTGDVDFKDLVAVGRAVGKFNQVEGILHIRV